MFSSMGAADAWTPKQSRITLWDEIKSSPCGTCPHAKDDKNECRLLPACPLHIRTLRPPEKKDNKPPQKKHLTRTCNFPGCSEPCSGEFCRSGPKHAQVVYNRRKRYPFNSELWTIPVCAGGRHTLKKRLERQP